MKLNDFFKLAAAIVVSQLAGVIGSVFTVSSIQTWYAVIQKPVFNPPGWIFAPVWIVLYFLMGVSLFLVWKSDPSADLKERKKGISLFFLQLVLNALWSVIFFGLHNPFWAFIEIIVLWLAILLTIISFSKISKKAAYLLLPYIVWVSFASILNFSILIIN